MREEISRIVDNLVKACFKSRKEVINLSLRAFRYLSGRVDDGYTLVVAELVDGKEKKTYLLLPQYDSKNRTKLKENAVKLLALLMIEVADGNVIFLEKRYSGRYHMKVILDGRDFKKPCKRENNKNKRHANAARLFYSLGEVFIYGQLG